MSRFAPKLGGKMPLNLCIDDFESPFGPLFLAARADDGILVRISFLYEATRQQVLQELIDQDFQPIPDNGALEQTKHQLDAYFTRKLTRFDLPMEPHGTSFQRDVWQRLCAIPYGTCQTYGDLAKALGKPGASRAVGLANNRNPIPIVIPCHRVIGGGGKLTGFGGGLDVKHQLLVHEGYYLI